MPKQTYHLPLSRAVLRENPLARRYVEISTGTDPLLLGRLEWALPRLLVARLGLRQSRTREEAARRPAPHTPPGLGLLDVLL